MLLDVFYMADGKHKPVIIFVHGFKGFKDWGPWNLVAKKFAKAGFIFIKFNFSHNGTTPDAPDKFTDLEAFGQNNFTKELYDIDQVLDWALNNNLVPQYERDNSRLYLLGHSRGGSTALIKASEDNRVAKVVSWAAVSDLASCYAEKQLNEWQEAGVIHIANARTGQQMPLYWQLAEDVLNNPQRLSVERAVKSLTIPAMVLHGTEDSSVKYEESVQMKRWNSKIKLNLMPGADHVFNTCHPFTRSILPDEMKHTIEETVKFFHA